MSRFGDALLTFEPRPDALLRRISSHIDDAMLVEIARADYGLDADAHLAALRTIRDEGVVPAPLGWEPKEVLELVRWSQPGESPGDQPPEAVRREHWMRAFCCAVLLRASGEDANRFLCEGQSQTVIQLVWSLEALDAELERDAIGLLVWLIGRLAPLSRPADNGEFADEDSAFFGVALIWLGLQTSPPMSDAALIAMIEWVCERERRHNERHFGAYGRPPGPWLLGTTYYNNCHDKWRELGAAMRALDLSKRPQQVADWIRLIGELLSGE
jgi:hypothetical protein